jgi:hypothetical protein
MDWSPRQRPACRCRIHKRNKARHRRIGLLSCVLSLSYEWALVARPSYCDRLGRHGAAARPWDAIYICI